jgi:hypothetical protein
MPDGSINVKITADAAGFISAVQQAQQGATQLASSGGDRPGAGPVGWRSEPSS